jgi:hypothetical protein
MKPVTLTHSEFVGACAEIARMTGRDPGDVAAGLAASVTVTPPARDYSRINLRVYCHDVAQLTATAGCTVSQALSQLRLEDYDGVR